MPEVFIISDTHFGHNNIVKFNRSDGSPLRPWDNVDQMDDALIKNWNRVVGEGGQGVSPWRCHNEF